MQQKAATPSQEEWLTALATIRQIALDDGETDDHRAHAVTAYVKALLWKKPHDHQGAIKFCREVLKGAGKEPLFAAALRAAGRVERDRRGHLGAEMDFLASFSGGSHAPTAAAIRRELLAIIGKLAALGAKPMVPAPVACRLPAWASAAPGRTPSALRITMPMIAPPPWYRFQPAKPHPALHVTHPKIQPPSWYRRVSFPPLKAPKK